MSRQKSRSHSVCSSQVPYPRRCTPATPGPHQDNLDRVNSSARFPGASPKLAAKLPELRRQLFGTSMQTRSQMSQDVQEATPPTQGISSLDINQAMQSSDESQEPQDAGSPALRGRPRPPEVEDALTQIVQTLQNLQNQQQNLAQQQHAPQAPNQDVPEDPAFDWN